ATKALADLQRATRLDPAHWRAQASLDRTLIVFGRRNEAADALERAWRLCPNEQTRTQLAMDMFQLANRWPTEDDD
ncbi:MAG: hypothetical protein AB7S36_22520, partial [Planctomycetota bacterium]